MVWARGASGASSAGAWCRFFLSQPKVIVVVMVVPDPVTNEINVTVTGNGVIVEVTVEVMGVEIVLQKVQVSDNNRSEEVKGRLPIKGRHVVLKDVH